MQMPKPGKFHKKLEALVGDWTCDEQMHPTPWDPTGGPTKGRNRVRMALDGFAIVQDYEQKRGGKVTFRGHGIIGYDPTANCYVWHWSDSMGGVPCQASKGQWNGNTLQFQNAGPQGHARYTYTFLRGGKLSFDMECSSDGQQWAPMMTSTCVRKAASS
jgi:hypothetical protein